MIVSVPPPPPPPPPPQKKTVSAVHLTVIPEGGLYLHLTF